MDTMFGNIRVHNFLSSSTPPLSDCGRAVAGTAGSFFASRFSTDTRKGEQEQIHQERSEPTGSLRQCYDFLRLPQNYAYSGVDCLVRVLVSSVLVSSVGVSYVVLLSVQKSCALRRGTSLFFCTLVPPNAQGQRRSRTNLISLRRLAWCRHTRGGTSSIAF